MADVNDPSVVELWRGTQMNDLTDAQKGFRQLSRHLVSLSCGHFVTQDHSDTRYFMISGFLVSMNDNWHLATAAHVLESVDQLLADHPERTYVFRIFDSFDPQSKHSVSIPFEYQNSVRYRTNHLASGADFGPIHISSFYRRQMEANPQTPIDERNWRVEMDFKPAAHIILGIPNERVSAVGEIAVRRDTTNYQRFEVIGLQVKHIPEAPQGSANSIIPCSGRNYWKHPT